MVRITKQEKGQGTVILKIEGKLSSRAAAEEVRNACDPYLAAGETVDLDLSELDFADAAGLCVLKPLLSRGARTQGISIYLSHLIAGANCNIT